jgi:hypothetical protein
MNSKLSDMSEVKVGSLYQYAPDGNNLNLEFCLEIKQISDYGWRYKYYSLSQRIIVETTMNASNLHWMSLFAGAND